MAEMRSKGEIAIKLEQDEKQYSVSANGVSPDVAVPILLKYQLEVLIDIRDQLKRIADRLEPVIIVEDK